MPFTLEHYGSDGKRKDTADCNYSDQETPTGVLDGVNVTYVVMFIPNPEAGFHLFLNGQLVEEGDDYTRADTIITFLTPPFGKLRATYRY
jgi:hypothetical protein